MDSSKAGVVKTEEKPQGNKVHGKTDKAKDPAIKTDEHAGAGKHKTKEHEHGTKSDHQKNKHGVQ